MFTQAERQRILSNLNQCIVESESGSVDPVEVCEVYMNAEMTIRELSIEYGLPEYKIKRMIRDHGGHLRKCDTYYSKRKYEKSTIELMNEVLDEE